MNFNRNLSIIRTIFVPTGRLKAAKQSMESITCHGIFTYKYWTSANRFDRSKSVIICPAIVRFPHGNCLILPAELFRNR